MNLEECLKECYRLSFLFKRRYEPKENPDGSYFPGYIPLRRLMSCQH